MSNNLKQNVVINDKPQGSVAMHLKCDFNNQLIQIYFLFLATVFMLKGEEFVSHLVYGNKQLLLPTYNYYLLS